MTDGPAYIPPGWLTLDEAIQFVAMNRKGGRLQAVTLSEVEDTQLVRFEHAEGRHLTAMRHNEGWKPEARMKVGGKLVVRKYPPPPAIPPMPERTAVIDALYVRKSEAARIRSEAPNWLHHRLAEGSIVARLVEHDGEMMQTIPTRHWRTPEADVTWRRGFYLGLDDGRSTEVLGWAFIVQAELAKLIEAVESPPRRKPGRPGAYEAGVEIAMNEKARQIIEANRAAGSPFTYKKQVVDAVAEFFPNMRPGTIAKALKSAESLGLRPRRGRGK